MKDNVINLSSVRGIPTPRFITQQIKQDLDQDLMLNMVNSHPGHLARARAKRDRYLEETRRQAEAEARAKQEAEDLTLVLGGLSVASLLGLILTAALAL